MCEHLCNKTVRDDLHHIIKTAIYELVEEGFFPGEAVDASISVETPREEEHGDLASNAALVLGSVCERSPREIAEDLVEKIQREVQQHQYLESIDIAGPGFINVWFSDLYFPDLLMSIENAGGEYGSSNQGQGKRVQVEFVSANPTGPLVVVQARSAALGDVICRLLNYIGYDGKREYYVNDAGGQIEKLGKSLYYRILQLKGRDVSFPEEGYPGDYVRQLAKQYLDERGEQDLEYSELGTYAAENLLSEQQQLLKEYGVEFDKWYRESEIRARGEAEAVLKELRERGYAYEKDGAIWLKSTEFEDDKDRVLVKSDGSYTYLLPDLAYHKNKLDRGFDWLIDILGPDHHGYVQRIKAGLWGLGYDGDDLTVLISQWVRLLREGQEVSMSKRDGTFISMRELLDDVGTDAARFFFIMRSANSPLDFDIDLAKEQSSENPVYYAQYAHARICSVIDEARERGIREVDIDSVEDLEVLEHDAERALMKYLGHFPEEVLGAAESLEPHRIATYVLDLAAQFHVFYTECRILGHDANLTAARLHLAVRCRQVLRIALHLLGVEAPNRM